MNAIGWREDNRKDKGYDKHNTKVGLTCWQNAAMQFITCLPPLKNALLKFDKEVKMVKINGRPERVTFDNDWNTKWNVECKVNGFVLPPHVNWLKITAEHMTQIEKFKRGELAGPIDIRNCIVSKVLGKRFGENSRINSGRAYAQIDADEYINLIVNALMEADEALGRKHFSSEFNNVQGRTSTHHECWSCSRKWDAPNDGHNLILNPADLNGAEQPVKDFRCSKSEGGCDQQGITRTVKVHIPGLYFMMRTSNAASRIDKFFAHDNVVYEAVATLCKNGDGSGGHWWILAKEHSVNAWRVVDDYSIDGFADPNDRHNRHNRVVLFRRTSTSMRDYERRYKQISRN